MPFTTPLNAHGSDGAADSEERAAAVGKSEGCLGDLRFNRDDLQFDLWRMTLHKGEKPVTLPPKPLFLLAYLADHPSQTFRFDELQAKLGIRSMTVIYRLLDRIRLSLGRDYISCVAKQQVRYTGPSYRLAFDGGPEALVRVAKPTLTVPLAPIVTWHLERLLPNTIVEHVPLPWSDDILYALAKGYVDVAIYNQEMTKAFRIKHPDVAKAVHIAGSAGHSMNGRNFYILAHSRGRWGRKRLLAGEFYDRLERATIFVPDKSDLKHTFVKLFDLDDSEIRRRRIEFVEISHEDDLKALFDGDRDRLVMHGQDLRYRASTSKTYFELINYDSVPLDKQNLLFAKSANCVVVSDRLLRLVGTLQDAKQLFEKAWLNFRRTWRDDYKSNINNVVDEIRGGGMTRRQRMEFAQRVLLDTYGVSEESVDLRKRRRRIG